MRPFVKPIKARDRKEWLKVIDETHAMHRADAAQSFAEFERENRECHSTKTDEQFREHYVWWVGWSKKQRDFYSDRERALQRYFYLLLMIDAKQSVPTERLIDLEMVRHFEYENSSTPASWEALDSHLVSKKPLTASTSWIWPASD